MDVVRTATQRLVAGYVPADPAEAACRDEMLQLLDGPGWFAREAPAHITASAVVSSGDETLLHLHRRARRWLQPGGHVDAGELPWDAAVRETREETGILAAHPGGGPVLISMDRHRAGDHIHLDLRFLLCADAAPPVPGEGESAEVVWLGWDEAVTRCAPDAALQESLRRARALGSG